MPAPKPACVKRLLLLGGALAMLAGPVPARAVNSPVVRTIETPNVIPTVAREAYNLNSGTNGLVGYVVSLTNADNKQYTLKRVGPTGQEDFDVYFYANLNNGGECSFSVTTDDPGYEQGWICPESGKLAAYAVVVMPVGLHGTFELSWG